MCGFLQVSCFHSYVCISWTERKQNVVSSQSHHGVPPSQLIYPATHDKVWVTIQHLSKILQQIGSNVSEGGKMTETYADKAIILEPSTLKVLSAAGCSHKKPVFPRRNTAARARTQDSAAYHGLFSPHRNNKYGRRNRKGRRIL